MSTDPIITQDNPKPFLVRVKLLTNQVYDFQVDKDINVSDFKVLISPKVNVPVERMRIVYSGKQLMDDKKLSQYVQQSGMTVHLIARSAPQPEQNPPPQNSSNTQSAQNVPRQQNPFPNAQNPNINQNPFDIMGMVNSMLGGVQQAGSPPQITMSFGNIGGMNGANNNPFGLLSSLGIRIPGSQPPNSTTQANSINNQPSTQVPNNNLTQNNTQPSNQTSAQTVVNQVRPQARISYAEISQLNQRINNLNVPLDNILSQQQVLTPDGVIRYLRRLHHQNTRSMLHLNRLLNLAQTNNNTSNLETFIPIFESLNSANTVAIHCLNELQSTRNNHQNRNVVSSSQQNSNQQQAPVISMGIVISDQQPRTQNEGQVRQSNQQRSQSNSGNIQNTNQLNRPQSQQPQQQFNLPQLNLPNSQGSQLPFNPLQLLGSFDPNMLSSVGGVGGILGMTLKDMISQGQEEPRGVFLQLFGSLTGNHLMQIFITKNFRFLQQKHPEIRQTLKKMISTSGRQSIFNSMVSQIENYIVPTQPYPTINNLQKCRTECIKNIRKYVNKMIDLSLSENEPEYDVKIIELVKAAFCQNIKIVALHSTTKHESTAFEIMKYQTLNIINPILPGIGGMFYGLVQRDFVRVYNEFKADQERRKQMSEEQGKSEERLIQLIKETGPDHSQFLSKIEHSDSYLGKKKEQ